MGLLTGNTVEQAYLRATCGLTNQPAGCEGMDAARCSQRESCFAHALVPPVGDSEDPRAERRLLSAPSEDFGRHPS